MSGELVPELVTFIEERLREAELELPLVIEILSAAVALPARVVVISASILRLPEPVKLAIERVL